MPDTNDRRDRPLESNLSYRLAYTSFLIGRATSPVLAAHGVTTQQWKVLSVLARIAPATAQEVTGWITLDKSAVSRTVRSLLEQGLVTRQLQAGDARNVILWPTATGTALAARLAQELAAVQADITSDISAAAMATLFRTLRQIEANLAARPEASRDVAPQDARPGTTAPVRTRGRPGSAAGSVPRSHRR